MGKYSEAVQHWYVKKWVPQIAAINPPHPDLKWFAVPPYESFGSHGVQWFPTGEQAHAYLQALRPQEVNADPFGCVNPISSQKPGFRNPVMAKV